MRLDGVEPYFDDGQIVLYCGDSDLLLSHYGPESWDIVVTSPPYNMGLVPGGNGRGMYKPGASNKAGRFREGYEDSHDDAMDQEAYDCWQRQVLDHLWRIARHAVFYNHRPRVEHGRLRIPLSFDFGQLVLRQIIIWDRGTGIDVNLRNFCTRGEWILLFAKPSFTVVDHAASGMGDVWRLGMATNNPHPAPFPVSLPGRAIAATGARSVLDPYAGSGSALRAALDAGIEAVGIEKSEPYCEMAVERFRQRSLFGGDQ